MSLPNLSRLVQTEGGSRDGDGNRAVDDLLQGDLAPGILDRAERNEIRYTFNAKLELRTGPPRVEVVLPLQTGTAYTAGIQRTLDHFDTPCKIAGLEMKLTRTAKTHFVNVLDEAVEHPGVSMVFKSETRDLKDRIATNLNNAEVNPDVQVSFLADETTNVPTDVWITVKFEQRSAQNAIHALVMLSTEDDPRVERFLHDCVMDVASAVGIRVNPNRPGELKDWTQRADKPFDSDPQKACDDWYELSQGSYKDWSVWLKPSTYTDRKDWMHKFQLMFERRYYGMMRLPDRKVVPPSKEWQQVIDLVREQQRREAAMRAGTSGS